MTVQGIETLLTESYPYPDLVGDQLCNLHVRPCVMIPFSEAAFPDQMDAFRAERTLPHQHDGTDSASEENDRLLARVDDVEAFFAGQLWTSVLDPALSGFSTELLAAPYRDTTFESAIHADFSPRWKIEAYLFTTEEPPAELERIREAKEGALRSLRNGRYPTERTEEHRLAEIRAKNELFGYPDCCTERFLEERQDRFDVLLEIGAERIEELRAECESRGQLQSAFKSELEARGLPLEDLNVESRIVQQLEYVNVGRYFEEWSEDELTEFYRRKSRDPLPDFFYAFFSTDFYPHHPRCEAAIGLGRRIESALQESNPALVPLYRAILMTNVFSCLGFDDRQVHRRLLSDTIATHTNET
jgi:hypothetical protein